MIILNENKTISWNVMWCDVECLACGISKSGFAFIATRLYVAQFTHSYEAYVWQI